MSTRFFKLSLVGGWMHYVSGQYLQTGYSLISESEKTVVSSQDNVNAAYKYYVIWSSLAQTIRTSLRQGKGLGSISFDENGNLNTNLGDLARNYYMPLLVFLGILLALVFILILMTIILRVCGKCCTKRRQKEYTKKEKMTATVLVGLSCMATIIGIVMGISSSFVADQGLKLVGKSVLNVTNGAVGIIGYDVPQRVDKSLTLLENGLTTALSNTSNLFYSKTNDTSLTDAAFNSSVGQLYDLEELRLSILTAGDNAQVQSLLIKSMSNQLQKGVDGLLQLVLQLNSQQRDNTGKTFTLTTKLNSIALNNMIPSDLLNGFSNISAAMDTLRSPNIPDLSAEGANQKTQYNQLKRNITDSVTQSLENMRKRVNEGVDSGRNLSKELSKMSAEFTRTMNTDSLTLLEWLVAGLSFYGTIHVVASVFFLVAVATQTILVIGNISFNNPREAKKNVRSCPFVFTWIILFFMAISTLAISTLTGDACNIIFDNKLSTLTGLGFADSRTGYFAARDNCTAGKNPIMVAQSLKLIDSSQSLDIQKKVAEQLKNVTWSSINGGLSTENILSIVNVNVSQLLTPVYQSDYAQTISGISENSALTESIPSATIKTQLGVLKTAVENLLSKVSDPTTITVTPDTGSKSHIIQIVQDQALAVLSLLNTFLDDSNSESVVSLLNKERELFKTAVSSLNTHIQTIKTRAKQAESAFSEAILANTYFIGNISGSVNTTLDAIKTSLVTVAGEAQVVFEKDLNCKVLGDGLVAFQHSLCGVGLNGLDGSWFALVILSLTCLGSIPVYILAANRLAYPASTPKPKRTEIKSTLKKKDIKEKGKESQKEVLQTQEAEAVTPSTAMTTIPPYSPLRQQPVLLEQVCLPEASAADPCVLNELDDQDIQAGMNEFLGDEYTPHADIQNGTAPEASFMGQEAIHIQQPELQSYQVEQLPTDSYVDQAMYHVDPLQNQDPYHGYGESYPPNQMQSYTDADMQVGTFPEETAHILYHPNATSSPENPLPQDDHNPPIQGFNASSFQTEAHPQYDYSSYVSEAPVSEFIAPPSHETPNVIMAQNVDVMDSELNGNYRLESLSPPPPPMVIAADITPISMSMPPPPPPPPPPMITTADISIKSMPPPPPPPAIGTSSSSPTRMSVAPPPPPPPPAAPTYFRSNWKIGKRQSSTSAVETTSESSSRPSSLQDALLARLSAINRLSIQDAPLSAVTSTPPELPVIHEISAAPSGPPPPPPPPPIPSSLQTESISSRLATPSSPIHTSAHGSLQDALLARLSAFKHRTE